MKEPFFYIRKWVARLLMVACGAGMASCDDLIYDDLQPCEVEYRVKFKYDYNMKYADAFPHEVHSVKLYVFDENGRFVKEQTEEGDTLTTEDYAMKVELPQGRYELITWAGLENQESFRVPQLIPGTSTKQELTCRMNRSTVDGKDRVEYLQPLWHGAARLDVTGKDDVAETITVEVPLVKNTNTFRIILQQLAEEPIDVDNFEFTIDDANGHMAHDNSLMEDTPVVYFPYHRASGYVETEGRSEGMQMNVAIAELSVARLVETQDPVLTIFNKNTGEVVFRIPLMKYLGVFKTVANYQMPLQEFLDREDEYVMHFFLDHDKWIDTQIIINDWIVRYVDIIPAA